VDGVQLVYRQEALTMDEMERRITAGADARLSFLEQFGEVEENYLAPLINPAELGGPMWPAMRQAWRVVHTATGTMVVSDGLSDPFEEDGTALGFRLEIAAEDDESPSDVAGSWLFSMVYKVSQLAAHYGNFAELLDEYGSLSTPLKGLQVPGSVLNENDEAGVLIGVPGQGISRTVDLPEGKIQFVLIKLLMASELQHIENHPDPAEARDEILAAMAGQSDGHVSSVTRTAVV